MSSGTFLYRLLWEAFVPLNRRLCNLSKFAIYSLWEKYDNNYPILTYVLIKPTTYLTRLEIWIWILFLRTGLNMNWIQTENSEFVSDFVGKKICEWILFDSVLGCEYYLNQIQTGNQITWKTNLNIKINLKIIWIIKKYFNYSILCLFWCNI